VSHHILDTHRSVWAEGNRPVCDALLSLFCRCERLEEQLNDLTELHQNEILNLKQELASMEEKIAYQSYERARDIQVSFAKKTVTLLLLLSEPFH